MSSFKKIHNESGNACHSGLNIFGVPPTNIAINKTTVREILPMNSIDESPYEFRVFSDNQWIDLSKTYLYLQLSIEKKSGTVWVPIDSTDTDVGPIQNLGQSFVRQLKLHINGTEIYDSSTLYPYLSYIKNELTYSNNIKDSVLNSGGYYRDNYINSVDDYGFKNRMKLSEKGKVFELLSRLDFDLANQSQFLLNNLDLQFTIYKADNEFMIHSLKKDDKNEYRIKTHSVKLYVKTIDVQNSLNLSVLNNLEKNSAKYAVRKTEIRSCFVSAGRTELTYNVFTNIIPRRLIVAFVSNTAFKGTLSLSPFNFQNFNVREITVNAAGINFPTVPYNLKFDEPGKNFMRAYMDMESSCNVGDNNSNGITINKFLDGWSFFVIPLCSTLDDCSGGFELIKNGTTTVHVVFNKPVVEQGISMLMIGEFDQLLTIDQNRVILTDGSA